MFGNVHVYVDQEELALLRAEHVRLYPYGREEEWNECGLFPEEVLTYEIYKGMDQPKLLAEFAEDYLDWDEMPLLAEYPHFEDAWDKDEHEWSYLHTPEFIPG